MWTVSVHATLADEVPAGVVALSSRQKIKATIPAPTSDPEDDFVQDLPDPNEIFIPSPQPKAAKRKASTSEESDSSVTESPPSPIKDSQGRSLVVKKMLTSARGKSHLLDSNNHRYRCDGEYQGNKHWRCLKKGCKARVHSDPNLNIIYQVNAFNHNHLADARDIDNAELDEFIRHKAQTTNHAYTTQ